MSDDTNTEPPIRRVVLSPSVLVPLGSAAAVGISLLLGAKWINDELEKADKSGSDRQITMQAELTRKIDETRREISLDLSDIRKSTMPAEAANLRLGHITEKIDDLKRGAESDRNRLQNVETSVQAIRVELAAIQAKLPK